MKTKTNLKLKLFIPGMIFLQALSATAAPYGMMQKFDLALQPSQNQDEATNLETKLPAHIKPVFLCYSKQPKEIILKPSTAKTYYENKAEMENELNSKSYESVVNQDDIHINDCELKFVSTLKQDQIANQVTVENKKEWTAEPFRLRNENQPVGKKILRSALFMNGTQIVSMGVLFALPSDVTNWSNENPFKSAGANIKRAWSEAPVWDKDNWAINYISHPHSGSVYYNLMRSQGATPLQSFAFAAVESTLWEFVIEAIAEKPSIQDLIITPIVGSLLGELSHQMTIKMRKNGFNFAEKVAVIVLNPGYVLNNGFRTKNKIKK